MSLSLRCETFDAGQSVLINLHVEAWTKGVGQLGSAGLGRLQTAKAQEERIEHRGRGLAWFQGYKKE